ncbi:MAG TPA: hypothetical protein VMS76_17600 [Planctomycetota bacterium]|nr:hypothetical protein [Planctomycetota bacterium]
MQFNIDSTDASGIAALGGVAAIAWVVFAFIVTLGFAMGVLGDALERKRAGKTVALVGPVFWFMGALVGSFLVFALYWAMHYSILRAPESPARSTSG